MGEICLVWESFIGQIAVVLNEVVPEVNDLNDNKNNSLEHLLKGYSVLDTLLSTLHAFSHLIFPAL